MLDVAGTGGWCHEISKCEIDMLLTSLLAVTQRDEQNKACEMACIKKPKRSSSSSKLVNRRLKNWLVTQWGSDLNPAEGERAQG
jgi:hypothetical protein